MAKLTRIEPGKWKGRFKWTSSVGDKKEKNDTERTFTVPTDGGAREEKKRAEKKYDELLEGFKGTGREWTVAEAVEPYLAVLAEGTERTRRTHLERFAKAFGPLKLSQVPPPDIQRWLTNLSCSDATAGYHRRSVVRMYAFAFTQGKLRGTNPMKETFNRHTAETAEEALARCAGDAPRRALLGEERSRFFAALYEWEPEVYPIMRMQFMIGGRVGESIALQLTDVDWKTGLVTVRRNALRRGKMGPPKNKQQRLAALSEEGLAFLKDHRERMAVLGWPGSDVWLFPRPPTHLRRRYDTWPTSTVGEKVKAVLRALEINLACSTHSMRHTHVTLDQEQRQVAIERDAGLEDLQKRIGHKTERMTKSYTDQSVHRERQRVSAQKLGPAMASIFPPPPGLN